MPIRANDITHLALNAERKLTRDHMLPDGVPASAEALVGNGDVINSHETCDISDYTWTLEQFLLTTGEVRWADKIEKAVFNARWEPLPRISDRCSISRPSIR